MSYQSLYLRPWTTPAFVPTAAYAGIEPGAADMNTRTQKLSSTPRSATVRPLGTKKNPRKSEAKPAPENNSGGAQKVVDTAIEPEVSLSKQNEAAITPPSSLNPNPENKTMTLTFKNLSKNGKNAFYTGAAVALRIPLSAFPGKAHPDSIDVADGTFAAAKVAKSKLTKEERAALPKPTLAERIAKREEALARDKAKLAAASAM